VDTKKLIELAEEWCGWNAYDSDRRPTDEHTCDDSRGVNCSADELLDYLKTVLAEQPTDSGGE
jgi:hypothetical protein